MSIATLAYIPPERLGSGSFLRNLNHYKRSHPLILYSDCSTPSHDFRDCRFMEVPDPTLIKRSRNRVAIHNRIFLYALEHAKSLKLKRFIYLEGDCRVGCDNWDERMAYEASGYKDMFVAGTPAVYNSKALKGAQEASVHKYLSGFTSVTGWPVPVFEARQTRPLGCLFIMGAAAVYNTSVMADLFMGFERDAAQKAVKTPAFDLFVGMRCAQLFGANAVSKLPALTCSFSSYGTKVNSEEDRVEMLRTGRACVVHQVKSNKECIW